MSRCDLCRICWIPYAECNSVTCAGMTAEGGGEAEVSALEREIDARLYGLYGLTAAEIALVEDSVRK